MYPLGQHPGTTWHRSDLQVHTPRDHSWKGEPLAHDDPLELDALRLRWAKSLVDHCLRQDPPIRAIAITDHHDTCIAEYVRTAASGSGLIVFPGVEVTCSDNAQCLVIFDPSSPESWMTKLIAQLRGVPPPSKQDSKAVQIAHSGLTVSDLAECIENDSTLRGKCLLLPHFGDGDAHKSLNTHSNGPRFAGLKTEGVYIEKPHDELEPATIKKVLGEIPEWGSLRRGIIATGDNKSPKFERLGAYTCWVKLGEPSIEALRQALLADEARICHQTPTEPAERIVEIEVLSKLTGDAPIKISFNPGFSAIVGGRGTGKSALLEYLRFGLGRTEADIPRAGVQGSRSREESLLEDTLTGGFVRITLEREGVREIWERQLSTRDMIECTDSNGHVTKLTLEAARERFRARAFRQKGLSSLTSDQTATSDQITGIAAAEALTRRREIDLAIRNSKRSVSTTLQQVVSHWQASLEARQAQHKVKDLTERLSSVNNLLAEGGVSQEHIATIDEAAAHGRALAHLKTLDSIISREKEAIPAGTGVAELPANIPLEKFPHLAGFNQAVTIARDAIGVGYAKVREALDTLSRFAHQKIIEEENATAALTERLTVAQEAQKVHRTLIDDATRLSRELADAEQSLANAQARVTETKKFEISFKASQRELQELLVQRREILEQAAAHVAGKSSGLLKARLQRDRQPVEYVSALLRLTESSHITDAEQKCSNWVSGALIEDQAAWIKIADELISLYEQKIITGSPTEPSGEFISRIRSLFFGETAVTERQAGRIYNNLSDSTLADVLAAVPQDRISLTYIDGSGKEMSFGLASPGQQASALLELLLRQSAGTLIIDQPEDDLDNRVIMKIVSLIRTSKANRQIIFTTHNPNIVVNGDADKVIALRTREAGPGGKHVGPTVSLQVDGAIETPDIRDYITNLIEGGREAFDLRSRKYGYQIF